MKTIKVLFGGCGVKYTDKNGTARHALKTPENGPFECDDEQAARLVSLGVAEYVGAQQQEETDESEKIAGHLDAAQLETMTNEQLKALAEDMGVDVSKCKKKDDYIAAIVAVEVEAGDEVDADDDLPELSAADPE